MNTRALLQKKLFAAIKKKFLVKMENFLATIRRISQQI